MSYIQGQTIGNYLVYAGRGHYTSGFSEVLVDSFNELKEFDGTDLWKLYKDKFSYIEIIEKSTGKIIYKENYNKNEKKM